MNSLLPARVQRTQTLLPLSLAQRGVWFGHLLESSQAVYNIAQYTQIKGDLDLDALARAAEFVARATTSLRQRICLVSDAPQFVIADLESWRIEQIDLSDQDDPEAAAQSSSAPN